jgi:hypothetical protein
LKPSWSSACRDRGGSGRGDCTARHPYCRRKETGNAHVEVPHAMPTAIDEAVGAAPKESLTEVAVIESVATSPLRPAPGTTANPPVGSPALDVAAAV